MSFSNLAVALWAASISMASCGASVSDPAKPSPAELEILGQAIAVPALPSSGQRDTATFASGCFWCVEAIFERLRGVDEAVSGYSGGHVKNPTYEQVCSHTTGHVEAVQVFFDPSKVSYQTLLEVYFGSMDPTQADGQGNDRGSSYLSVIFYKNEAERAAAEAFKKQLGESGKYDKPIAVKIQPLQKFWPAEDYHQNYERNHPENPYVQAVSIPRIKRMERAFPNLLK